jgi:hypothetical protein
MPIQLVALGAVFQEARMHDSTPERRHERQKDHRPISRGELRRALVSLQTLVAFSSMRVVVPMALELEEDVIGQPGRRVPGMLRLHSLEFPW